MPVVSQPATSQTSPISAMASKRSSTGGTRGAHVSAGTGGSGSAEQLSKAGGAPSSISEYTFGKTLGQGTFGKVCYS